MTTEMDNYISARKVVLSELHGIDRVRTTSLLATMFSAWKLELQKNRLEVEIYAID